MLSSQAYAPVHGEKEIGNARRDHEREAQEGDALAASAVGTNLQQLNDRQMTVLMRHGGALAEARRRKYAPELLGA